MKQLLKQFDVLYIEDDLQLLNNTSELFELLFKEVYRAKDGVDALHIYNEYKEEHNKYIDLVISDIEMPNMNGIETSKKILELNKQQKIIITSGYDDKKYFIELINIGIDGFIQKPLLSEHIKTVLFEVCKKLEDERSLEKHLILSQTYKYNIYTDTLFYKDTVVKLSEVEKKCLSLLLNNLGETFTALELFEHVYPFGKEFSSDVVKSFIKRLRKKLPINTIENTPNKGYFIILN